MNRWTKIIHHEKSVSDAYGANSPPIYQTATFAQETAEGFSNYDYSRSGNPTRTVLQDALADLEEANYAFALTSGMAAIHTLTQLLKQGDHLIFGQDLYGGTHRLFTKIVKHHNIDISRVNSTSIDSIKKAIKPNTKLVFIETPTNPLQQVTDIQQLANFLHTKNILLAVDNTFLSPWLQQPLKLGADIVIHSATKHLSGHSDLIAGVIAVNDDALAEKIRFIQNATGTALAAFPAWLLLRGIKTLGLRIERQQSSAKKIAKFLSTQTAIADVYYLGLKQTINYELHKKQAKGAGTVISFTTNSETLSRQIVEKTKLFKISVSFGSLTSLISLPYYMSHAAINDNEQQIPPHLIRLSIGIEDPKDLCHDLARCLHSVNGYTYNKTEKNLCHNHTF